MRMLGVARLGAAMFQNPGCCQDAHSFVKYIIRILLVDDHVPDLSTLIQLIVDDANFPIPAGRGYKRPEYTRSGGKVCSKSCRYVHNGGAVRCTHGIAKRSLDFPEFSILNLPGV
jgi:hypothetical protein